MSHRQIRLDILKKKEDTYIKKLWKFGYGRILGSLNDHADIRDSQTVYQVAYDVLYFSFVKVAIERIRQLNQNTF